MTKKLKLSYTFLFLLLTLLLIVCMGFSCTLGAANLSIIDSLKIMFSKIPGLNYLIDLSNIDPIYNKIVLDIRLPRIIMAALVGIGLSSVGCAFQGMFKNPMADPYVLGVSSGAAFGATIAMIFSTTATFFGTSVISICAFIGALTTTYIVYNIAKVGNKIPTVTLLLAGVAVSFFFQSCISIMMIFNRQQIENIVMWTMGSVSTTSWNQIVFILPFVVIGTLLISYYSRDLNAMLLGDDDAKSLGINVTHVKKMILLVSSILVAALVSVSGVIGFVGLIVPHAVRILVGPNHKILIPFSVVLGAIFLVLCDTLARTIVPPAELPVGSITAVFGSPYFIYLLYQNKKKVTSK